mmetsp:Transcript_41081/g.34620  ORF Transcript_41081/g.34620 Transcript_41081/m.34620 type:complete len:109 (+) Transcript_41081:487-813(+)
MSGQRSADQRVIQDLTRQLASETAERARLEARIEELLRNQQPLNSEEEYVRPIHNMKIKKITHTHNVASVNFSSDGQYLATGSYDRTAKITDVATGATLRTIEHEDDV